METNKLNLIEFIKSTPEIQNDAWYDWFCKTESLPNKTTKLVKLLKQIIFSNKFDCLNTYVFFKNNCPFDGKLYDDFRICDIATGDVLFTIIPKSGHNSKYGKAEVWAKENNFNRPVVTGTWKDVINYFIQ